MTDAEMIEAEAAYLEGMADKLRARAKELRELKQPDHAAEVETKLEAGAWKEATSKKCDYWRDAPVDLVETVRKSKGGIKGTVHHFTASTTEPTLFRFKRSKN